LNSVYKVLSQTVPDGVKTSEVTEVELYLRTLLSQVDSSLADEWERMRDPNYEPLATGRTAPRPPGAETMAPDVTRDAKAFTAAIRTLVFTFLRAWSSGRHAAALEALDAPPPAGWWSVRWTCRPHARRTDQCCGCVGSVRSGRPLQEPPERIPPGSI
jgi:hypothetical protein